MAGTVSFPNIGSNIDVQSIINAYVAAESINQTQMQQHATDLQTASTHISNISSALSTLSSAVSNLDDASTVQSYTATSSGTQVAASVSGTPQAGSYSVDVVNTANAFRAYSTTLGASASDAANLSGVLHVAVGSSSSADITISASDSLNSIVGKINSSGLRVSASTFYDGSNYRIQLSGLDTGSANQVALSGLDLGFPEPGNTVQQASVQQASDAHLKIDNVNVYSATNQISGAIPGVTLAAAAPTTSTLTVNVQSDPQGLATKIQTMVSAYNAVISLVHTTAGYGTTAASDATLAADPTLRSLTDALSSTMLTEIPTGTSYTTLGSIGISMQTDGTLALDSTKLTQAVTSDPSSVISILAGPTGGKGVMDLLSDLTQSYVEPGDGVLSMEASSLTSQASDWTDQVATEQERIDNYTTMLQAQFSAMTASMTASTSMANYLNAIFGTTSSSTSSTSSTTSK